MADCWDGAGGAGVHGIWERSLGRSFGGSQISLRFERRLGQQLKATSRYLREHNVHECWFAYFVDGVVDMKYYGVDCKRLPTIEGLWWLDLPMDVPPEIDGTVLISESDLAGIELGQGQLNPYESFRHLK